MKYNKTFFSILCLGMIFLYNSVFCQNREFFHILFLIQ